MQLPIVEDRMARLERALEAYVHYRGEKAVQNTLLPGMDVDDEPDSSSVPTSKEDEAIVNDEEDQDSRSP